MTSLILPDGSFYSGQLSSSDRHSPQGLGIRLYLSNRIYVGEWESGVMHGKGILLSGPGGDLFEGHFSRGQFHGRGFLFSHNDNRARRGVWKHGTLISVEDIVGNVDDANFQTVFRPAGAAGIGASTTTPQFKLMQMQAISATMAELRSKVEQEQNHNNHARAAGGAPSAFPTGTSSEAVSPDSFSSNAAAFSAALVGMQQQQQQGGASEPFNNTVGDNTNNNGALVSMNDKDSAFNNAAAAATIVSNQLLLTVSGPSYNFTFSPLRFAQFFFVFLFPFLSLPGIPSCPLVIDGLDLEREYVVSGAALRADFEIPTWEVYFSVVAIVSCVLSAALPHGTTSVGAVSVLSWSDIIVPCSLCVIFALLNAAYQCFHRTAHALERLDRHHFPRLAALAAQCIDSNCHTLVVSWDEEGLGRVMNRKYRYKWAVIAVLYGFALAFASPLVRLVTGKNAFASSGDLTEASAILSFICEWTVACGVTYQLMRIIDLERQLEESMAVITRCAYLQNQSIMRPSDTRKSKFHFDDPVSLEDTTQGFLGWYIVRSFVLYASTLSNHRSRHAYVSVMTLVTIAVDIAFIIDTFRSYQRGAIDFTAAHMFGAVATGGWGLFLLYFMYVSRHIEGESRKHLYLVDVAAMLHSFRDPKGASIIARCRGMVAEHDYASKVLGITVTEKVFAMAIVFHGFALSCVVLSVTMWVLTLLRVESALLNLTNATMFQ